MDRFIEFALKNEKKILFGAISLYIAGFSGICLWKYGIFGYDALDLAIFNQVFWNTAHGRLFEMTIHPQSYLGDHAGLIILPLSLIYRLFADPRTLLILQTIALAIPAYPLWIIAKKRLNKAAGIWRLTPLAISAAWLLNPMVHNINLFEFHLLPFALAPLFFAYLAYEDRAKIRFLVLAVLAMLVREDVSLVIAGFGILAALERRGWWWRLAPITAGAAWFAGAMSLISRFAPEGSYKFQIYYSWLGNSPTEMAVNAVAHPLKLIAHLVSLGNLELLLGLGLPLLFLPYLAPRLLVLAAGPFLQILLGAPGGNAVILETHYSTLFLPALFVATIAVIAELSNKDRFKKAGASPAATKHLASREQSILFLMILASIYSSLAMGPLPHAAGRIASGEDSVDAETAKEIIDMIPDDASVSASYRLLAPLSSRENIYSNHYIFLGTRQFATGTYEVPESIDYLAFDADDLLTYRSQFMDIGWARPYYPDGRKRLSALTGSHLTTAGNFSLFDTTPDENDDTSDDFNEIGFTLPDNTTLLGARIDSANKKIYLRWKLSPENNDKKRVDIRFNKDGAQAAIFRAPLVNDLKQNTNEEYIQVIDLPTEALGLEPGAYMLQISLSRFETIHVLDGIRSTMELITEEQELGATDIGVIEVE
jgi:uncharacterized membrane protein